MKKIVNLSNILLRNDITLAVYIENIRIISWTLISLMKTVLNTLLLVMISISSFTLCFVQFHLPYEIVSTSVMKHIILTNQTFTDVYYTVEYNCTRVSLTFDFFVYVFSDGFLFKISSANTIKQIWIQKCNLYMTFFSHCYNLFWQKQKLAITFKFFAK